MRDITSLPEITRAGLRSGEPEKVLLPSFSHAFPISSVTGSRPSAASNTQKVHMPNSPFSLSSRPMALPNMPLPSLFNSGNLTVHPGYLTGHAVASNVRVAGQARGTPPSNYNQGVPSIHQLREHYEKLTNIPAHTATSSPRPYIPASSFTFPSVARSPPSSPQRSPQKTPLITRYVYANILSLLISKRPIVTYPRVVSSAPPIIGNTMTTTTSTRAKASRLLFTFSLAYALSNQVSDRRFELTKRVRFFVFRCADVHANKCWL